MEPVVRVRDLRMRYGDNDVLTGVDFDVAAGQVVCLLGPNGAGKTTTIEILEGFRIRSAGEVTVLGQDPAHADEDWRARTGVVLQSWRDHPRWTPRKLLTQLGGYFAPYSTPERRRPHDIDLLLETVGLTDLADRKIATLSGGQRRRLDVAVGIVGRPELLFLDEPTAGFDPQARRSSMGWSAGSPTLREPRSCSRRTTSTRPRSSPTGCSCSRPGGSSPTTPSTGSSRRLEGGVAGAVDRIRRAPQRVGARCDGVRAAPCSTSSATRCRTSRCVGPASRTPIIALVQQHEAGHGEAAAKLFAEVTR